SVGGFCSRRGKSGLHRAGCRVTPGRYKPKVYLRPRRGTGPQRRVFPGHTGKGETRQPPPGATPSRRTTTLLAESAGRWLEPRGDSGPRGMTVHDRTRLIGQLHFFFAPAQTGANFF